MPANDRIDLRLSKEHKKRIKYAAELSGFKTVSEFIVTYAMQEASRIIGEEAKVLKSVEDKILFTETLLDPPAPNTSLKVARDFYNAFLTEKHPDGFKNSGKKA